MEIRFDGKTAIVTGSGGGIGRVIARTLAACGANVAIADIKEDLAQQTASEIEKELGVGAIPLKVDISKEEDATRMVAEAAARFGSVDILVNNAGLSYPVKLLNMTAKDWDRMIAVNLTGTMWCGKAAIAQMVKQGRGGVVINISSKSGVRGSSELSHYCATKFGAIGLAQSWAREYARQGIRCCSVLPGNVFEGSSIWNAEFIAKQAAKLGIAPDQVRAHYDSLVPLGRSCLPEDIANAVVFLASDLASYITGISLLVDGGQEMRA
ncbi:MAG: glucose 1-dehydrogenase [Planctomycetes bacterium]|nr:glucose 1-dehydrogenase [Planctomycetota bacterium]